MRDLAGRIRRLEKRFGDPVETEFSRRLRKRIESARERLAEARQRGAFGHSKDGSACEARRRQIRQILGLVPGVLKLNDGGKPR